MALIGRFVTFLCCITATLLSDYWKVVFEFYIKWCENGFSGSILLRCVTVHYPNTERSKYSNCMINLSEYGKVNQGIHFHHHHQAHSLLWLKTEAIINAYDPMQNLGQTWIFINWVRPTWPGQNVTWIIQMTQFQP